MATNPLILGWICKNNMLGMPTLPLTVEMALYGHLWGLIGCFEGYNRAKRIYPNKHFSILPIISLSPISNFVHTYNHHYYHRRQRNGRYQIPHIKKIGDRAQSPQ